MTGSPRGVEDGQGEAAVDVLIVGAGVSGLGTAGYLVDAADARGVPAPRILVVEAEDEPGGWCKTVERAGFTWDYSGHFFHFRHKDIEQRLVERMAAGSVRTIHRRSRVRVASGSSAVEVDFPFQKNIHQLPTPDFLACLVPLVETSAAVRARPAASFKEMLEHRFGAGICERFLVPYNEKLYATDLNALDVDAMGRFFPTASLVEIVRNFTHPDNGGYNATFTYPRGGAVQYIHALQSRIPNGALALSERVLQIDLQAHTATTTKRTIRYRHLVTSAPLPKTLQAARLPHDVDAFAWNSVLVFNLGFDKKGRDDAHWIYFADKRRSFYRVGFYDNIFGDGPGADRMSLYVEIGMPAGAAGAADLDALRARVIADLRAEGLVTDQALIAWHAVAMDPAYVHITTRSLDEAHRTRALLRAHDVHSIGRYGAWTYCSIEDNLVEARALAGELVGR